MFNLSNKSSFCSYRWDYLQVNIDQAQVRNCCQCPSIQISKEDSANPDFLLNNPYVLDRRKELLRNFKHGDCKKCWKSEGHGAASMRSTSLSKHFFLKKNMLSNESSASWYNRINPKRSRSLRTLEISLGNLCNLKCHYCSPMFSSAWEKEHQSQRIGAQIVVSRIGEEEQNQISKNTLLILDQHLQTIEKIIFTGGEPLINNRIYPILKQITEIGERHRRSNSPRRIELQIVTNLSVPEKSLNRFLDLSKELIKTFNINISASIDNTGSRAEYIRTGLDWKLFEINVHKVLSSSSISWLSFHTTLSIFNTTSMIDVIKLSKELFDQYGKSVPLMDNMVTVPFHLSPLILTADFSQYLQECSDYVSREIHSRKPDFQAFIDFTKSTAQAIRSEKSGESVHQARRRFVEWVSFYDKLRKTSFLDTFPEYKNFYDFCSSL